MLSTVDRKTEMAKLANNTVYCTKQPWEKSGWEPIDSFPTLYQTAVLSLTPEGMLSYIKWHQEKGLVKKQSCDGKLF